jgi:2-iminobutanoate/2-iminopropanoate deaminase
MPSDDLIPGLFAAADLLGTAEHTVEQEHAVKTVPMSPRTSIYLPGFSHVNPIPVASRIGPFLASGLLTGRDPVTHEMPAGLDEQCANVFTHVRSLTAAADATTDDIVKMTFWLADPRNRDALNREWLAMFPDPTSRPARQAVAAQLDGGALVQCDLLAVLDAEANR